MRAEAESSLSPAFALSLVFDAGEWLDACERDEAQLWNLGKFWAVTQVRELKSGRALNIVACAGEYDDRLRREAEQWARNVGCQKVYFYGRKGWAKRLPDYRLEQIVMSKEI